MNLEVTGLLTDHIARSGQGGCRVNAVVLGVLGTKMAKKQAGENMTCQNSDSRMLREGPKEAVDGKFQVSMPYLDPGDLGLFPKRRFEHHGPGWTAASPKNFGSISLPRGPDAAQPDQPDLALYHEMAR